MRLQKFMAHCGIASRRKCENIIEEGRVCVNGRLVTSMGLKVDPIEDVVTVDGGIIDLEHEMVYIAMNKPNGYISAVTDQFNRPTVVDLIGDDSIGRIYPVGRLDYDSEGLILLTNDGKLAYKLTHPKYQISKEYSVTVKGEPSESDLDSLREGIYLEGSKTQPAQIAHIAHTRGISQLNVVLVEGRNRQIRKMFDFISHPVISLQRVRIGNILLGDTPVGRWRYLTKTEVEDLKKKVQGIDV